MTPSRAGDFALEVVRRLQQAGYQVALGRGLRPRPDPGPDAGRLRRGDRRDSRTGHGGLALSRGHGRDLVRRRAGPRIRGMPGIEVEVATFRSDGAYVDGRRPESVVFSSPELDAARRDFTINGMFLDPLTDELIDYVGGQADLKHHVLRAIGDPLARFREDKLRVLRAVRLAARFQLQIEPATLAALKSMAARSSPSPPSGSPRSCGGCSCTTAAPGPWSWPSTLGLVAAILPRPAADEGVVPGQADAARGGPLGPHDAGPRSLARRSQLHARLRRALHDVGKPPTRVFQHGRYAFHNHEQVGAGIADRFCRDLKLSNAERERITWLVAFHQYLGEARKLRESKLKRILAEPGIEELLALHRADALASTGQYRARRLLPVLPENRAGRPDQSAAADHRPRPCPARPQAGRCLRDHPRTDPRSAARGRDPEQA